MLDPLQHGVQRHLLQHEAAAAARVVQLAQVPLPEEIVRPLVHRMVEVVGPRIDGQFFQQCDVEHRFVLERGIDAFEDREGTRDQVVIAAHGHARPADEKRDRPDPFMRIGLDLLLRAKHGDGPVAEVIVQLGDCGGDDAIGFLPRPTLLQHGFADPADKQRLEQPLFRLVKQQVGMELAVAGQGLVEDQPQHGLRLVDLAEGLADHGYMVPAVKILQGLGEKTVHRLPGRFDPFRAGIYHLEEVVDVLQEPGIRRAGRKVEISEDFLPCLHGIRPLTQLFHAKNLRLAITALRT